MKLWYGYGSEHSMNLVMIGRFKEARDAAKAKKLIDQLTERVSTDVEAGLIGFGGSTDRFSDGMLDFLGKLRIHSIGPAELEQFTYDVTIDAKGAQLAIRTDESDVSAFLKILLECGGRVEVYSAHNYPDNDEGQGS